MSVELASKTENIIALGEGTLPILVQFVNSSHVLKLVQYVPGLRENVLSVRAFNAQFSTSVVMNSNNGFILSRKLRRKLSLLYVSDGLYRVAVRIYEVKENSLPIPTIKEANVFIVRRILTLHCLLYQIRYNQINFI